MSYIIFSYHTRNFIHFASNVHASSSTSTAVRHVRAKSPALKSARNLCSRMHQSERSSTHTTMYNQKLAVVRKTKTTKQQGDGPKPKTKYPGKTKHKTQNKKYFLHVHVHLLHTFTNTCQRPASSVQCPASSIMSQQLGSTTTITIITNYFFFSCLSFSFSFSTFTKNCVMLFQQSATGRFPRVSLILQLHCQRSLSSRGSTAARIIFHILCTVLISSLSFCHCFLLLLFTQQ